MRLLHRNTPVPITDKVDTVNPADTLCAARIFMTCRAHCMGRLREQLIHLLSPSSEGFCLSTTSGSSCDSAGFIHEEGYWYHVGDEVRDLYNTKEVI
jgi:hypothetical protein